MSKFPVYTNDKLWLRSEIKSELALSTDRINLSKAYQPTNVGSNKKEIFAVLCERLYRH
jgi:hypothetical protein